MGIGMDTGVPLRGYRSIVLFYFVSGADVYLGVPHVRTRSTPTEIVM